MSRPKYVAQCRVTPGWGYEVLILSGGEVVEEYSAGDSPHDSQVYATGRTSRDGLRNMAALTADEMLAERGMLAGERAVDVVFSDSPLLRYLTEPAD